MTYNSRYLRIALTVVFRTINEHDSNSATKVIQLLKDRFNKLIKIITDGGCRGELIENTKTAFGLILEIILRKDDSPKFQIIPKRWG